jgi:hypothetical protein
MYKGLIGPLAGENRVKGIVSVKFVGVFIVSINPKKIRIEPQKMHIFPKKA